MRMEFFFRGWHFTQLGLKVSIPYYQINYWCSFAKSILTHKPYKNRQWARFDSWATVPTPSIESQCFHRIHYSFTWVFLPKNSKMKPPGGKQGKKHERWLLSPRKERRSGNLQHITLPLFLVITLVVNTLYGNLAPLAPTETINWHQNLPKKMNFLKGRKAITKTLLSYKKATKTLVP